MALVMACKLFILEGYTELKEKEHLFDKAKYVRKQITHVTWESVNFCDEEQVDEILEEKLQKRMKEIEGWGRNFEGWSSYRKYAKPGELEDYPEGGEIKRLSYFRDWPMKKVFETLNAKQFALVCKELEIYAGEAINEIYK